MKITSDFWNFVNKTIQKFPIIQQYKDKVQSIIYEYYIKIAF